MIKQKVKQQQSTQNKVKYQTTDIINLVYCSARKYSYLVTKLKGHVKLHTYGSVSL